MLKKRVFQNYIDTSMSLKHTFSNVPRYSEEEKECHEKGLSLLMDIINNVKK